MVSLCPRMVSLGSCCSTVVIRYHRIHPVMDTSKALGACAVSCGSRNTTTHSIKAHPKHPVFPYIGRSRPTVLFSAAFLWALMPFLRALCCPTKDRQGRHGNSALLGEKADEALFMDSLQAWATLWATRARSYPTYLQLVRRSVCFCLSRYAPPHSCWFCCAQTQVLQVRY